MRLVTYDSNGTWRAGIIVDEDVVDSSVAAMAAEIDFDSERISNRRILQLSGKQRSELEQAAGDVANARNSDLDVFPMESARLGPPIPDPDKIICLGLNYKSHAEEAGFKPPEVPILFAKYRNALTGPTSPIVLPKLSQETDYEAELAVVIGKRGKDIPVQNALEHVAGYMAFHDVSARDLQFRAGQWLSGKTPDTFAPCGPALVVDEIGDPQNLSISMRLNGETLQSSNTRHMIFPVAETIAYISQLMTLEPGDIIATGTPEGVGFKRTPPIFLKDGDVVEVEVEKIGILRNPVVRKK
jgi:2-keto-4-pentenoate hydratase/2-oxohepta-3-ene-1,7-dioic acid hydratase in catechol pathway